MPIKPRGESFQVTVGSGKDRVRVTCATLPEAQAKEQELILSRKEALLKTLQAAQRGDSSKTMQDAYDRTYREVWATSKGVRTTTLNAKQMVALFGPNTPITEITTDVIDDVLDTLADGDDDREGNSGATINRKLAVLNVMLRTAQEKGWIKFIPRTKRRDEAALKDVWYSEEEERAMLDACYHLGLPGLADYIRFAIDTGFRRSEALKFRVDDFQGGFLRLHKGQTKNDKARTLPATEVVKGIIEKAAAAGHTRVFEGLTESTLRGQWNHLRAYLGKQEDPKYIVHVLRHTTATRLAIAGATAPQIMAYMGHKAIQTSMRYTHLAGNHLGVVADLLTRTPPPAPALRLVSGGT